MSADHTDIQREPINYLPTDQKAPDPGVALCLSGGGYRAMLFHVGAIWRLYDGGLYDNLGLETAWKRYDTILVSDAGGQLEPEEEPKEDWARHSYRVLNLIDGQVRSLRKRQVIQSYCEKVRKGAYWGIRTDILDYKLEDPIQPCPHKRTMELAETPTRLKRMDAKLQERLIDWGYAVCDAALRKHVESNVKKGEFPYPGTGV